MRENLVGYVLGALDDAEHEEIEKGLVGKKEVMDVVS